jgi:alkylation response protein AidB-like acyl-CoA dehydrogenase
MSAAEALARLGTADLGEEANEFRAQIRRWISASVPSGLADMAQRMAADAISLLGPESLIVADGYGLNGWQQAFLASRSDTIWGGTAEIQRNIIAERLLGLPKEPLGGA